MNKINNFIEQKVAPVANKLSTNKYLQVLQSTFLALVPLFTLGSFALVITSPSMDYTTMDPGILRTIFQGWQAVADFTGPALNSLFMVTMPLMSLYVAFAIGYFLTKQYKMNTIMPAFMTLASFVLVACIDAEGNFVSKYLDATGLFSAIIVSIFAFEFYRFLVEKKFGHINLDGVGIPPVLSDSLGNLVPVVTVLLTIEIVNCLFVSMLGFPLPELITTLMSPLVNVVDNVWGIIILAVIVMIFWWFGIHDSVITSALDPFFYSNLGANAAAFAAGTAAVALPHIVTSPFWWNFMAIGGSGATFGLAILALTSKSKQIKTVGKLGIIPAFFNINEPIIFGLPLMYNPIMMIPFILVMPLNGLLTYLVMKFGIIARTFAYASWNMFCPIAALIDTMDFKALIFVVILIIIDMLVYLPFFKVYEKQKIKEEMQEKVEA